MGRIKDDYTRQVQLEAETEVPVPARVERGTSALLARYRDALERILEIETYRHPEVGAIVRTPAAEIAAKALGDKQ